MSTFRVTVTQLVPHEQLSKHDDRITNPAGTYIFLDAEDEEEALDEFHSSVPIGCLDDFEITAQEVDEGNHTEESLQARFDQAVDDATHAVITEFEWMRGLPEGEQLGSLMVKINDAITAIMQEWK